MLYFLQMIEGADKVKKIIVVEEVNNGDKRNNFRKLVNNRMIEWLLYMFGYAIVLIVVSVMFSKTIYINNQYFGVYAFLAAVIIYILNQTIKPVLFYITLPITALTFGLFYSLLNVLILYITSFILGDNFQITGVILSFVIAIIISVLNMLMEGMIIKPIIYRKRVRR